MGGVRRASLLLLITIPPPPVLQLGAGAVDGWSRVERGGGRSGALTVVFPFSFMCIFPIASSEVAEELTQEHSEYFYFTLLHPPHKHAPPVFHTFL